MTSRKRVKTLLADGCFQKWCRGACEVWDMWDLFDLMLGSGGGDEDE